MDEQGSDTDNEITVNKLNMLYNSRGISVHAFEFS